jgi:hypothetical protein
MEDFDLFFIPKLFESRTSWQDIRQMEGGDCMDYILRNIEIELWSKVKAKPTLERKTMREVMF